jgi:hypothetical protein
MMVDVTHRVSRDAGQGWSHLVDLYLVKNTVKVDKIRWLLAHDPEFAMSYLIREKLKFLQRMEQTLATGWMEPPKPLTSEYIDSIPSEKVVLGPTTVLSDWQRLEDGSYFDGAKVYMNSIAAAKLGASIGVRGVPHALDKRTGETYSNPSLPGWGTWVCPVEIIYAGKSDARHRLHQVGADVKKYLSDPGTDTAQAYIRVRCSQNGADYTVVYGPEEFTNTSYQEHLCTLSSDYVTASGSPLYIRIEVNIYRDVGDIGITQAWIKDPRINDRYQDGYRLELT